MEASTHNDIFAELKEHRQQLAAHQKQLEDVDLRLQVFRQRQQELEAQLKILHEEKEYLEAIRQEWERKQQQRGWYVL